MHAVIFQAQAKFASLAGIAKANILPLCYVRALFECVVEGTVRFGRWLYATSPSAGRSSTNCMRIRQNSCWALCLGATQALAHPNWAGHCLEKAAQ